MNTVMLALHVLILAGGSRPNQNFNSHHTHVETLIHASAEKGIPPERLTIFWADGHDDAPDRAVLPPLKEPIPLALQGHPFVAKYRPSLALEDTKFPGYSVYPATRSALQAWISDYGSKLTGEDVLLIAVTDHGEADPAGSMNTSISLWGEAWTVEHMISDLEAIPTTVNIALWMSQCYSGGFARLAWSRPNICGAYSAEPNRMAYGCYPDLAVEDDVGHFVHFLDGLVRTGSLYGAHRWAVRYDDTPDTPQLSSEAFLRERLTARAEQRKVSVAHLIDRAMAESNDSTQWREIARLAEIYGLGLNKSFQDVVRRLDQVKRLSAHLEEWKSLWTYIGRRGQSDFLRRIGAIPQRRSKSAKRAKDSNASEFGLSQLRHVLNSHAEARRRLESLTRKHKGITLLSEEVDLHEAALIRLSYLFLEMGGVTQLTPEDLKTYRLLKECEARSLWAVSTAAESPAKTLPHGASFPELQSRSVMLQPSFLGVRYRQPSSGEGAEIQSVVPGSPAMAAGLRKGDILAEVGGVPIKHHNELAELTMLATRDNPTTFRVTRGTGTVALRVRLVGLPPKPPKVQIGDVVSTSSLTALKPGQTQMANHDGHPKVLFFWATWCGPCKRALPKLAAWSVKHNISVYAVTSEDKKIVEAFVAKRGDFPLPIMLDVNGQSSERLEVESLPHFILLDQRHRLRASHVGFRGQIPFKEALINALLTDGERRP